MMIPSKLISFAILLTSSILINAQSDTYVDFIGQKFCATRTRSPDGKCCNDRVDECSVPISGTLCYCDEFCNKHRNPDCCPDYRSFCLEHDVVVDQRCRVGDIYLNFGEQEKLECNLCTCRAEGRAICEQDPCLQNKNLVDEINRDYSLSWKSMEYPEFLGRKLKEGFELRLGTFEPRIRVKGMTRLSNQLDTYGNHFFAPEVWPGYISEIRDQGWCGSSWAVSSASVASDRFGIKMETSVDLSSQNLLSCVRHQQGCNGGHLDNAWRYFNKFGVFPDECYTYQAAVTGCRANKNSRLQSLGCSINDNRQSDSLYKMGPGYSLYNETDIMWEIKNYGPVQATMWVYQDFFSYKSGIYRRSTHGDNVKRGFHSVRLVGWGESKEYPRTKYWIAANSWGTWWGDRGYFKILRGANECDIERYVLAALPEIHESKPNKVRRNSRKARKIDVA